MNPVVYVGPSFRSSRLNQFMVFSDGAPLPEAEDPIRASGRTQPSND